MSREIDNALLTHGGTEDIDIPAPAARAILTDAICAGELTQEIEALKKQNAENRATRLNTAANDASTHREAATH